MKNFLKILTRQSKGFPQEKVVQSFRQQFGQPVNVEWQKNDSITEAIFYLDEVEHIARYNKNGRLEELLRNLQADEYPEEVKTAAGGLGEIMNIVHSEKKGSVTYEVIIRDHALKRFLLLIDEKGEVVKKGEL